METWQTTLFLAEKWLLLEISKDLHFIANLEKNLNIIRREVACTLHEMIDSNKHDRNASYTHRDQFLSKQGICNIR